MILVKPGIVFRRSDRHGTISDSIEQLPFLTMITQANCVGPHSQMKFFAGGVPFSYSSVNSQPSTLYMVIIPLGTCDNFFSLAGRQEEENVRATRKAVKRSGGDRPFVRLRHLEMKCLLHRT